MQRVTLLLNRFFSATTQTAITNPNFVLQNDYYVNLQNVPNKVVNQTNVRAFLEDPKNSYVVNGFVNYMTGSTTLNSTKYNGTFTPTSSFNDIYYNDEKLANLFNSYFEDSALKGNTTPNILINAQVTATPNDPFIYNNIITYTHNFYWEYSGNMQLQSMNYIPLDMNNNIRKTEPKETLIKISTDQNYYIPVFFY